MKALVQTEHSMNTSLTQIEAPEPPNPFDRDSSYLKAHDNPDHPNFGRYNLPQHNNANIAKQSKLKKQNYLQQKAPYLQHLANS